MCEGSSIVLGGQGLNIRNMVVVDEGLGCESLGDLVCVTGDDSMMFQMDGVCVAGLQSASCGIPWLPIATRGSPEEEVNDLKRGWKGGLTPRKILIDSGPKSGKNLKLSFTMESWKLTH